MTEALETPLITPAKPGFLSLLAGIIFRPVRALEAIRDSASRSWLVLALLAMVFLILPIVLQAPISAQKNRAAIEAQLQTQANGQSGITPEMQSQATSFATNPLFTVVLPGLGGVIGLWLGWLLWAGALHLMSTMLGGSNHFGQMWRAVVWCAFPFTLRGILQTLYVLTTGKIIEHPGFSGYVLPTQTTADVVAASRNTGVMLLGSFLSGVDIFLVWNLILLIVGVCVMARVSKAKSIAITLLVWIIFTVASLLPTLVGVAMSSGMGG